jgi:hypothetical protein
LVELAALGFDGGRDVYSIERAGGDHFGSEVADGLQHGREPGGGFFLGAGNEVFKVRIEVYPAWRARRATGTRLGFAALAEESGLDVRDDRQHAAEEFRWRGGGWLSLGHDGGLLSYL